MASVPARIERHWEVDAEATLRERFVQGFGDVSVWAAHRKSINLPRDQHRWKEDRPRSARRWRQCSSAMRTVTSLA